MKKYLPFVERFRPKSLEDVVSHDNTIKLLRKFITTHNIPHLLFYGPPGTGKTSTIESFVNELYGEENVDYMTMNINASEERGIDVVRSKIANFARTRPVYMYKHKDHKLPNYKFIILDEADAMTYDAQATLRKVMETYTFNARFCLICNHIKSIDDAIKSRCVMIKFGPMQYKSVVTKIQDISQIIGVHITEDGINTIWKLSNGDMRKIMHMLQIISINYKTIDADVVTNFQKYPTAHEINMLHTMLSKKQFNSSIDTFRALVKNKFYSLHEILTELTELLIKLIIEKKIFVKKGIYMLTKLRDIEMNIITTSDTDIQLCAIVSIFM